jgi:hypothetical protein
MNTVLIDFIAGLFDNRVGDLIKVNDVSGFVLSLHYPDDAVDFATLSRIRQAKEIVLTPCGRSIDMHIHLDHSFVLPTDRLTLINSRAGIRVISPSCPTVQLTESEQLWVAASSEILLLKLPIEDDSLEIERNASGNVCIRGIVIKEITFSDLKELQSIYTKSIITRLDTKNRLVVYVTSNLVNRKRKIDN